MVFELLSEKITLISVVYFIFVFGICLKILLETRSPTKGLAHIALIIFLPVVGIIFYFAVGINYRNRNYIKRNWKTTVQFFPNWEMKEAKNRALP